MPDQITTPTPDTTPTPKPVDQTFDLVVDGTKRTVTLDEMKTLAQKSAGADQRFQDANTLRKEAEDGIHLKNLVDRMSDGKYTPTPTEVNELATMIGVDPKEFAEYLELEGNKVDQNKDTSSVGGVTKEDIVKALGFDPKEAKAILDYSHQRHIDDARKQIRDFSDSSVDKDDVFGKMIVGENGKDRSATIKDMVAEDVLRSIQDGKPFGADLVAASIQKVRAHLTKIGIPGNPSQYPVSLGLGPGSGLPAEVQSETPIKRLNSHEDTDESNFVARVMQRALKAMRGG